MKRCVAAVALSAAVWTASAQAAELSAAERQHAMDELQAGEKAVLDSVAGMSEAQWRFKPSPDRWSAAEVVEHVTITHRMVLGLLNGLSQAPAAPEGLAANDAAILTKMEDRSHKAKAPEVIQPHDTAYPATTVVDFVESTGALQGIAQNTGGLRAHAVTHPVFGPCDGYQWILLAAGHDARHSKQILELKADPNYPAK